jgi:mono/diheme cytochrome c family protein
MKKAFRVAVAASVAVAVAAIAWASRHPEIDAIARPDPASFDPELVERGKALAGLGNCGVCHTTRGGEPYAGGLALPTPFGTIYTTNITPDVETGIGGWSEAAFVRAMRDGVDREGRHLYPAFPYDFYALVTDEDLGAIYAYLMTTPPVVAPDQANGLRFPFDQRILLEGWKVLFHDAAPFVPDPGQDAEWNRGAYLVEGLGHCGACHSPRNALGAPARAAPAAYAGGEAEGWYAPPLDATTPAPIPWTQIALVNYLIDGWDKHHGIAAGPMAPVASDLYEQSEDDVFAIAGYLMHLKGGELPPDRQESVTAEAVAWAEAMRWGNPVATPLPDDPVLQDGAQVFETQCANCHKMYSQTAPLGLSTVINAPDATNLVQLTFRGLQPPHGSLDRSMPARAIQISDDQMVALAAFVRDRFSRNPAWTDTEEIVRRVRAELAAH